MTTNNTKFAIIDNKGIMDNGNEDEIRAIWNDEDAMDEREFKGRVLLVEIIDEK